jgi:signal transduction histidine kinase
MTRDGWVDTPDDRDLEDTRARRRRRRRRRSGRPLSDEERAWREAKRRAKARVGFYFHLVAYAATCTFLFAHGKPKAFPVVLFWGLGLAFHYFSALVAPNLRRRLVQREVRRQGFEPGAPAPRAIADPHVRSLEDLSAQVAHEIRNPITAAKSLVQQMGEDPTSAENVGYAKVALEELDRVERSVAHLLRFAREEDLRLAPVALATVIDSALESFRDRIAAERVKLVHDDAGHESLVRADAEKLRRVLINLIGNALDALAEQPADPTLEVLAGENLAGTECWVRVRDNGPGIAPDALAQIWSPFFSAKPSGTGLGLAIAKKLVEAHGGTIEIASQPGAGAEFTIALPKLRADA